MSLKKMFVAVACLVLLPTSGARAAASRGGVAVASGSDGAQRIAAEQHRRVSRRRAKRRMSKRTKAELVREGLWGGAHVRLSVKDGRADVLFDCAHGEIAEPLGLDSEGRFVLRGTLVREHGGPVLLDEKPDSHPARYSGKVSGDEMSLTVTLTDSGKTFDTFTLTRGSRGQIWKCY